MLLHCRQHQLLLAYQFDARRNVVELLDVGPHESFYRERSRAGGARLRRPLKQVQMRGGEGCDERGVLRLASRAGGEVSGPGDPGERERATLSEERPSQRSRWAFFSGLLDENDRDGGQAEDHEQGTTAGMLAADGLAVWAGSRLGALLPMWRLGWAAAALFMVFGLAAIAGVLF